MFILGSLMPFGVTTIATIDRARAFFSQNHNAMLLMWNDAPTTYTEFASIVIAIGLVLFAIGIGMVRLSFTELMDALPDERS